LTAGLPLVPLAPVSDVPPERLPEILTAVAQRLRDEAAPELMKTLWIATAILTGLRYPREQVSGLIEGVATMVLGIRGIEESWVYQDIFTKGEAKGRAEGEAKGRAEGEVEEARKILLGLGRKKLGQPDEQVLARIAGLSDLAYLNRLLERLFDVTSWDELLAGAES
jgi:predicted transposase YdaD